MLRKTTCLLFSLFMITTMAACQKATPKPAAPGNVALELIAESDAQWTGLAVSSDNRLFVNYPYWMNSDNSLAVAEVLPDGKLAPFPSAQWQGWQAGDDPANRWVCVQALYRDDQNKIWVLDPANPRFEAVVEGGAKLVRVDPNTLAILQVIRFEAPVINSNSYLNDVRVDLDQSTAYITDSGDGALIVVNLKDGSSRRLLDQHVSTESEGTLVSICDKTMARPDGKPFHVHADGIALSPDKKWIYYQTLTGKTLYRVPTLALRNQKLSETELARTVEKVTVHHPVDGIMFGADGYLYLSDLNNSAITRWSEDKGVELLIQDEDKITWPDSFSQDRFGRVWFTTARIHEGSEPTGTYRVYALTAPEE